MKRYLATINGPEDLKRLNVEQLPDLAAEIRSALIQFCDPKGGHIGSNLGLVEASIALHYVFDSPCDRMVFDVSHQSYTHKMLTGRRDAFTNPDLFGTVTGFTNPDESDHDQFVLGHTGTSVSLACGMSKARDLLGEQHNVIAVIGDGSLSSAVAFEGLNEAAELNSTLIIVFNDNEMSIAENHGGMYQGLARLRDSNGRCTENLFRDFGLDYRYVEHGNDTAELIKAFREVKNIDHPVVVHIHTLKGLGLPESSEGRVESNHWQNAVSNTVTLPNARKTYGIRVMDALAQRFDDEPGLVVISPATPGSNGITRDWRAAAGRHYVDTGITEEHAVTFAAGIGQAGGTPVLATSATFFQRAYDQIHQEFALNHAPGTLLVFAAGISGTDNTHSGAGDITLFGNVPGLTCLAPASGDELMHMLAWSTGGARRPVAIRMPGEAVLAAERAGGYPMWHADDADATGIADTGSSKNDGADTSAEANAVNDVDDPWDHYTLNRVGHGIALMGLGNTYPLAEQAAQLLIQQDLDPTVVNPHQFSTLDTTTLDALAKEHQLIITLEDGQLAGGWGSRISAYYGNTQSFAPYARPRVIAVGAAKEVTDRVPLADLQQRYGLNAESIANRALQALQELHESTDAH